MSTIVDDTVEQISAEAAEIGVHTWLCVRSLTSDRQVDLSSDQPVVLASVLKIVVAVELARQATGGHADLDEHITLHPSKLTPSPCGLGVLSGPVTLPVRDLAVLMLSVSDNAATDVLIDHIGLSSLGRLTSDLELPMTVVPHDCASIIRSVGEDLGLGYVDDEASLTGIPRARLHALRALDPAQTSRSTAREMVELLTAVWRDEIEPPGTAALVRDWLSHQAWEHRLASGFGDDVAVIGKTGTLPGVRNEAGIVTYPDGRAYAVAVFTRADDFRSRSPVRDQFLGRAARLAVEALRRTEANR